MSIRSSAVARIGVRTEGSGGFYTAIEEGANSGGDKQGRAPSSPTIQCARWSQLKKKKNCEESEVTRYAFLNKESHVEESLECRLEAGSLLWRQLPR